MTPRQTPGADRTYSTCLPKPGYGAGRYGVQRVVNQRFANRSRPRPASLSSLLPASLLKGLALSYLFELHSCDEPSADIVRSLTRAVHSQRFRILVGGRAASDVGNRQHPAAQRFFLVLAAQTFSPAQAQRSTMSSTPAPAPTHLNSKRERSERARAPHQHQCITASASAQDQRQISVSASQCSSQVYMYASYTYIPASRLTPLFSGL